MGIISEEGLFPCYCDLLLLDESVSFTAEAQKNICTLTRSRTGERSK